MAKMRFTNPCADRPWWNDVLIMKSRRLDLTGRTRVYLYLLEPTGDGQSRGHLDFKSMACAWKWMDRIRDELIELGWVERRKG